MAPKQLKRAGERLVPVAAAHPISDVGLVVPTARVDQGPELLRIARRASGRLPDEGVRLSDEALDLLDSAPAFEHVGRKGRDDSALLPAVQIGPAPPVFLHLQVDPEFEEERDARLLVAAKPRNPRVGGVLQHLVCGPGLPSEEPKVDLRRNDAGGDAVLEDRAVVPGESAELLVLDVPDRADDRDRGEIRILRVEGLRDRIGAAGAARDIGAFALQVRVQHQDTILRLGEPDQIATERARHHAGGRHMVIRDDGVESLEGMEHSRAEVDEPRERRAVSLDVRDDGLVERLDERDLVVDPRTVKGLRGDRSAGAARSRSAISRATASMSGQAWAAEMNLWERAANTGLQRTSAFSCTITKPRCRLV